MNTLKTTELYTLTGRIVWYVNYTPVKLLHTYIQHIHPGGEGDEAQTRGGVLQEKVIREHLKSKMTFEQRTKEGEGTVLLIARDQTPQIPPPLIHSSSHYPAPNLPG